jgi:hypothetical protein
MVLGQHPNLMHEKQKTKVTDVFASYAQVYYSLYLEANNIESIYIEPPVVDMIMEYEAPGGPGGPEM